MDLIKRKGRRIAIDGAGYILILISPLVGLLPGPGGIVVFLAGLGLLSVHNPWAHRLRETTLSHGGKITVFLFPKNPIIEWLYDGLVVLLLVLASVLIWKHHAIWEISVGVSAFFLALFIAATNRERLVKTKGK